MKLKLFIVVGLIISINSFNGISSVESANNQFANQFTSFSWHPSLDLLLIGNSNGSVYFINPVTFEKKMEILKFGVNNVNWNSNGSQYTTIDSDGIKIWSTSNNILSGTISSERTRSIDWNPDDSLLAIGLKKDPFNQNSTVFIWEKSSSISQNLTEFENIISLSWHPYLDLLLVQSLNSIKIWNVTTGYLYTTIYDASDDVYRQKQPLFSKWDPFGEYVFYSLRNGTFINVKFTDKSVNYVYNLEYEINAFSIYNDFIVVAQDDTAFILNKTTKESSLALKEHIEGITDIEFSYNGDFVALLSNDNTISIWNTYSGELILKIGNQIDIIEVYDTISFTYLDLFIIGIFLVGLRRIRN